MLVVLILFMLWHKKVYRAVFSQCGRRFMKQSAIGKYVGTDPTNGSDVYRKVMVISQRACYFGRIPVWFFNLFLEIF